ncbi:MAG: hypothetical protein AABW68_04740 [archaeon]
MKKWLLVFAGLFFFVASVHAGTCDVPDIQIFINGATPLTPTDFVVDKGSSFDMICNYSFDPPPGTDCPQVVGPNNDGNYYGIMMYTSLNTGDFNKLGLIPSLSPPWMDMNCSGAWCGSNGMPNEDRNGTKTITAIGDATYQVACGFRQGKNPKPDQISQKIKIHVYPDGCKPSTNGDFDSNQTCVYHDNELMIAHNYNIKDAGKHYLIDTNVRFYHDLNSSHTITVQNTLDFNGNGKWIIGLNGIEPKSFSIIPLLLIFFLLPFNYFSRKTNNFVEEKV